MTDTATAIRSARPEDFARIWDIRHENDIEGLIDPPAQGPIPPYLPHLFNRGKLLVAERAGQVLAYAGATERSGIAYLNDVFVDPAMQSEKLGQALLQAILPESKAPKYVLASNDFRAIALYARFGMAPRWPNFDIENDSGALSFPPESPVELVPVDLEDVDLVAWDAEISGRSRPLDFRFWHEHEQGAAFWCRRNGQIVGYAVARFAASRTFNPEAAVIGPVGVRDPAHAAACVVAVTRWAASSAPYVKMAIPGPHPALVPLLASGLRIVYTQLYGSSAAGIVDPERYVGSGGDLF